MADPVRRCAGCGRRAPQQELVRFALRDGALVTGRTEPGRGIYTCRDLRCFERARTRRRFGSVRVDPALARIYTGESHA
jgi:predicted RNA-binding protein YlxR (DUF448 family)